MILIIGGAYQGKLDFAKATFGIVDTDVYFCTDSKIDFSKKCIYRMRSLLGHVLTIILILLPILVNTVSFGKTIF